MGWKGTVRSISAAMNAAERNADRRRKAAEKQRIADDAAASVSDWEDYIDRLVSIHADQTNAINWHAIAEKPKPVEPKLSPLYRQDAEAALEAFKPSIFDVFHGGTARRRARLEADIVSATARDQARHKKAQDDFQSAVEEWNADWAFARRLVAGEPEAINEAIKEMESLSNQSLIGSSVEFSIGERYLHAKAEVHSDEIVPNFRRKQLASGKLSETKMPASQFNELYQDYVGSVALKIAGDLFNIIPLDEVYVTCLTRMLNPQTGHQELTPILSVQFVRPTFAELNLAKIDPSESMRNFNHSMSFKKTTGFAPIEPLRPLGD